MQKQHTNVHTCISKR
jgi:hypothetical protein